MPYFAEPLFLLALGLLPLIWLLLRFSPPRPQTEIFPPLILLKQLVDKKITPEKSPWWLLLLRLLLAAFVILALAKPIIREQENLIDADMPLILMIDNSFAAAPAWEARLNVARQLLAGLNDENHVYLLLTAPEEARALSEKCEAVFGQKVQKNKQPEHQEQFLNRDQCSASLNAYTVQAAFDALEQIKPQPLEAKRLMVMRQIHDIVLQENMQEEKTSLQWVYLTDGLQTKEDDAAFALLDTIDIKKVIWYQGEIEKLFGITDAIHDAEAFHITVTRADNSTAIHKNLLAYDRQARQIGEVLIEFAVGESQSQASLTLPLEIRNDIAFVRIGEERHAAATFVNDSSNMRHQVALLAPPVSEMMQPLVSPLYYPAQALRPYANLVFIGEDGLEQFSESVKRFSDKKRDENKDLERFAISAGTSLLVMADEVAMTQAEALKLENWIEQGGNVLRFAGSHLAASDTTAQLLPVALRRGERNLGGIMVWQSPQKIATPPPSSPLFGLKIPQDITISRQILPEPSPDLQAKSWMNLEDGTPLVTATKRGKGWIIFIHTAAMPDWSNLPLSGFFVDMLRRIVNITHQSSYPTIHNTEQNIGEISSLSPWQIISNVGDLEPPPSFVLPLTLTSEGINIPSQVNPPGLYGNEDFLVAVNLLTKNSSFTKLQPPPIASLSQYSYHVGEKWNLQSIFWALAFILFIFDGCIMLLQTGVAVFPRYQKIIPVVVIHLLLLGGVMFLLSPDTSQAQKSDLPTNTHLAFVKTGNPALDSLSQAGLDGLSRFIAQHTSLTLGEAVGVALDKDELAFYPLLYWPVEAQQPLPTPAEMTRLDSYMRKGGTVLFDTRDHVMSNISLDDAPTPAVQRLREILANLNIPPLEPAPSDHVIARSFYIMPDFPGRYRGGELWLEMSNINQSRAVQSGDGVSSILITANDFIGAWAEDEDGHWFFSTVPDEPMQRLWSLRGGLNIVLYLLTGNYKADQIHASEILKRLGQ